MLLFYIAYLYRTAFGTREESGRNKKMVEKARVSFVGNIRGLASEILLLFKPLKLIEPAESLLPHKGSIISEESKT